MHIFLDNFRQGGKYSAQIASPQEVLRREVKFTYQEYLSVTSLQTYYLNLDSSSGSFRDNERSNLVQKNTLFVEVLTNLRKNALKR